MTRTGTRDSWTLQLDDPPPPATFADLVELPDEPGEVVCRCLLAREDAMIELGLADAGERPIYLVAVNHCTHLSPAEARAAGWHLLRAADEAETRER